MIDTTTIAACEACPLGVAQAVASRGPVPARLLFLTGAPRYHEEHEGVAFASPAFPTLEAALSEAGLDPGDVHYATLTGCRPPYQRPVRAAEIAACAPRLELTIEAVAPEVVVLCGPDAVAAMLPMVALSAGHGRLYRQGRRYYYPIRHPYASLHYQGYENEVKDDLRKLAALLTGGDLDTHATVPHEAHPTPLHHAPAATPQPNDGGSPGPHGEAPALTPSDPAPEPVAAPSTVPAPDAAQAAASIAAGQPASPSTDAIAETPTTDAIAETPTVEGATSPKDAGDLGVAGDDNAQNTGHEAGSEGMEGDADEESNPTQLSLF